MKKYKFRLQTLLDQRQAKEDKLLRELGLIRQEEVDAALQLSKLEERLQRAESAMINMLQNNANTLEISRLDEYQKAIRDDIKLQELTIEAIRKKVEAKRNELVEAMKDRKVLEALRDKQEKEYIQQYLKAEQNEMDEMASVRYARGM